MKWWDIPKKKLYRNDWDGGVLINKVTWLINSQALIAACRTECHFDSAIVDLLCSSSWSRFFHLCLLKSYTWNELYCWIQLIRFLFSHEPLFRCWISINSYLINNYEFFDYTKIYISQNLEINQIIVVNVCSYTY